MSTRLSPRRLAGFLAVLLTVWKVSFAADVPPSQTQQGEYLARAGDCVSCHTAQGGTPYAGGLRMDTPFGYLLTPNLTSDPETGLGKWTSDEFYRALHHGVNRHGQDMFPVMPFDFHTKITRTDADALFAYLRTIPAVRNVVDINHLEFPFNQRLSMIGWREMFFTEGVFKDDITHTPSWNRGAYLVESFGHCSACHSPRNVLGGIEQKKAYSGATIDGWFALDLSSNLHTGLGSWTAQDIATYLKTGANQGKTTTLGPMAEVVQNSTSYLSDADLLAMGEYLKSIPPDSTLRSPKPAPSESRQRGAALYLDHCSSCHQSQGRGIAGVFPPLAGNGVILSPNPANIFKVVLEGIPAQNKYIPMPSLAGQLNDQQIADLTNYVRTSWGNNAAPNATAPMVAKLRVVKK